MLDGLRVGADVGGRNLHLRRNDVGELRDGQTEQSSTAPTITIRMAITMATMGRLMKNRDMPLTLLCRIRPSRHRDAGADQLHALGHYPLARLQTAGDDPHRADAVPHLDGPDTDRVVALDHGHL